MAQTIPTTASVSDFIAAVPDPIKRQDSLELVRMMTQISRHPAVMWGPAIIGFGQYEYRYDSGYTGIAPLIGFSPRKNALTLYLINGVGEKQNRFGRLGKHKTSKACLYIGRLSAINLEILHEIISVSFRYARRKL